MRNDYLPPQYWASSLKMGSWKDGVARFQRPTYHRGGAPNRVLLVSSLQKGTHAMESHVVSTQRHPVNDREENNMSALETLKAAARILL